MCNWSVFLGKSFLTTPSELEQRHGYCRCDTDDVRRTSMSYKGTYVILQNMSSGFKVINYNTWASCHAPFTLWDPLEKPHIGREGGTFARWATFQILKLGLKFMGKNKTNPIHWLLHFPDSNWQISGVNSQFQTQPNDHIVVYAYAWCCISTSTCRQLLRFPGHNPSKLA